MVKTNKITATALTIGFISFFLQICFVSSSFSKEISNHYNSKEPSTTDPKSKSLTISDMLSMSIEELIEIEVISAGFFPTPIKKAPGYSFVITHDQIKNTPARTLADIIEMKVPGMTVGGHIRHGPLIGTRGVFIDNNAKTMVMIDEQQINQRSHFGYTAGLLSPLLGDINQLEVILGPGAILHGSGAINGFINLIPKNGADNPGLFVYSEYGSVDEAWKLESGYGASYGDDKNIYVYGGVYGAQGYEPDELYGATKRFDVNSHGFEDLNYRFSLYWNHEAFNLNAFFYENNPYKNGTAEIGSFHQNTLGFRPKYIVEINDTDSVEIIGSLLWFDHSSPRDLPPSDIIDDRGGSENHWEIKNIYKTIRWDNHSLAAGFSYSGKEFFERKQFFSDDTKTWFATLDTSWNELSVFGEDVIDVTDAWTVSLGLRYDKIYLENMNAEVWSDEKTPEDIEGHFSPRIATAYEVDENTNIKASYQHGFRTPDTFYYLFNLLHRDVAEELGLSKNVPPLDIETMDSFELNFYKKLPKQKIRLEVNLFHNIYQDQLGFRFYDDIGLFTSEELSKIKAFQNLPNFVRIGSFLNSDNEIKSYGGEFNATFHPMTNSIIKLSYGYVTLDNADVVQFPEHQIKLNTLFYFLDNSLSLAIDYLYNSGYSTEELPNAHEIYRDDRHLVNMELKYRVNSKATVGLRVDNLFENNVPPMIFTPGDIGRGGLGYDERRYYLSLDFEF